jgi:putative cardiolipin synthase
MSWAESYRFVSDDPLKATLKDSALDRSRVLNFLLPEIRATERSLAVISPYFVPGEAGTDLFTEVAGGAAAVRILTNSLTATDVAAVHGGYSRHRKDLLEGGVHLWELKPLPGSRQESGFAGSSGASLHTKALAIDEQALFVGSYNLDPRSTSLNCEQGVLVRHEGLADEFEAIFDSQISGERAWRVSLDDDDDLYWSDGKEDFNGDPQAGWMRRFQAWLARVLHVDAQL